MYGLYTVTNEPNISGAGSHTSVNLCDQTETFPYVHDVSLTVQTP